MANGNEITDYLTHGSGAPSTPSLADNAVETGLYWRSANNTLYVWDGSAWQPVGGGLNVRVVTADYAMSDSDDIIIVNGSGVSSGITVTLPPYSGTVKIRTIICAVSPDSGNVSVAAHSGDHVQNLGGDTLLDTSLIIGGGAPNWIDGTAWPFVNVGHVGSTAAWSNPTAVIADVSGTGSVNTLPWEDAAPAGLQSEFLRVANRTYAGGFQSTTSTSAGAIDGTKDLTILTPADAFDVTLPVRSTCHKVLTIKAGQGMAGSIIVHGNGSETIDGAGTYTLAAAGNSVSVAPGPSEWSIVAKV